MKVALKQEKLAQALLLVGRVATSRAALPVLANVLIKVDSKQTVLTTTNLEIAITQTIGGKVGQPGAITVPARLFNDYINSLPEELVELAGENQKLHVKSGEYTSTINGMPAEEFPELPSMGKSQKFSVDAQELKNAIQQTIFSASSDETRPVLTGGYIHTHENKIYMVSTDSYRLAQKQLSGKPSGEFRLIIPANALGDVVRIIGDGQGTVMVIYDDTQIQFDYDQSTLITKQIEGQFPEYRQLISPDSEASFTIKKAEFLNLAKVASLFARESAGSVTLEVSQGEISINSVASQVGENTSKAKAKTEGEGKVTLNSRYLIEALNATEGEAVRFRFSGKVSPCVLTPAENDETTHIIMPLKS
ncbi:MAG TPA: DNA polymerase III subunit beta [Candidatus Saccharimonadales bacterium]